MKKITVVFIVIFASVLMGCDYKASKENSPSQIAQNQATIILNCFKTGETEELKSLFCDQVKSTHDLDKELNEAINFITGDIVNDGTWIGMSEGGKSIDNGIVTKLDIHPSIIDMETTNGNKYSIFFDTYLIYSENPQNIGMTYIILSTENDEEIMIGEIIY